jgi:hypothetical protein
MIGTLLVLTFAPAAYALRAGHITMNVEAARAKTAAKFEAMLNACTLPAKSIELIDDKKQRALFRGVAASAERENVRNAFLIVYQDMGPVRVAGDLIFKRLQKVASVAESAGALEGLGDESADSLAAARELFDSIDEDSSGQLSREELLSVPSLVALLRASRPGTDFSDEQLVDDYVQAADADGDGEISFIEWAQRLDLTGENLFAALDEVRKLKAAQSESAGGGRSRMSNGERFDEMLATCREWEEAYARVDAECADQGVEPDECPTGGEEDRLRRVLLGSFEGARCEPVAQALRVCYEEYSPLRFGGDLIFRVLKRVVSGRLLK